MKAAPNCSGLYIGRECRNDHGHQDNGPDTAIQRSPGSLSPEDEPVPHQENVSKPWGTGHAPWHGHSACSANPSIADFVGAITYLGGDEAVVDLIHIEHGISRVQTTIVDPALERIALGGDKHLSVRGDIELH